jgi:phosphate uptake regulator
MTSPSEPPFETRLAELEQRLEAMDDIVAQRCLAVLDAADALHRQSEEQIRQTNQRIDRLALQIDRNALAIAQTNVAMQQMVANANGDRAVMLEILQYLRNQYPGNGKSEQQ